MKKLYIFLADGFEEIEALTVVDLTRRAGFDIKMVSITDEYIVRGAHDIKVNADILIDNCDFSETNAIIFPGGMPGAENLYESEKVNKIIKMFVSEERLVGAICAAPSILGRMGLLKGYKATCYPGYEKCLEGAYVLDEAVVADRNIITSKAPGTAAEFALAIIEYLESGKLSNEIRNSTLYNTN